MINNSDQIRFGIPIDIIKASNGKGGSSYFFEGVASTPSKDTQGETLLAKAYDLSNFKSVNWNHRSKDDANAFLGEITHHQFVKSDLKIKGELFEEMPMTNAVINLMKALKKRGKKLQLSVEGQVLERGSIDPKDPAYKIIKSARLTGVAITSNPINQNTFCDLIEKGETEIHNWEYEKELEPIFKSFDEGKILSEEEIEKAMTAGSTTGTDTLNKETTVEATKKESIDSTKKCSCNKSDCEICKANKKVLSKSEAFESIFNYFYHIDFEKANKIYQLTEKISKMENTEITNETLNKAFSILDLASTATNKVVKTKEDALKEIKDNLSTFEKSKVIETLEKSGYTQEIANEAFVEFEKSKQTEPVVKFDNEVLQKSFDTLTGSIDNKFGAVGRILKSQSDQIESLTTQLTSETEKDALIKSMSDKIDSLTEVVTKIVNSPVRKNDITNIRSIERFEKGEDGVRIFNIANPIQKKALILELNNKSGFDQKELNGGKFDQNLLKAASDLEMFGGFSDGNIVPFLEQTYKIKVERN